MSEPFFAPRKEQVEVLRLRAEEMPRMAELYGDAVYGFCRRLTGSREDADELFQQTFLRAMELCRKINAESNPKCYLMGIAVRLWQNSRSKKARRSLLAPEAELCDDTAAPRQTEEEAHRRILCEKLRTLTQALPEKLRIAVLLHYGAQFSVEETAKALHLPQGTVKSRLFKARQILKKELEEEGYDAME